MTKLSSVSRKSLPPGFVVGVWEMVGIRMRMAMMIMWINIIMVRMRIRMVMMMVYVVSML